MPFCTPSYTGSTLARVSAIPTTALHLLNIPSCGSVLEAKTLAGAGVTPTAILLSWIVPSPLVAPLATLMSHV
jgi:hypothetical protein